MSASALANLETMMESLNSMLPSGPHDSERVRDPLDIFREFLDHLGKAARRAGETAAKANSPRAGKQSN